MNTLDLLRKVLKNISYKNGKKNCRNVENNQNNNMILTIEFNIFSERKAL